MTNAEIRKDISVLSGKVGELKQKLDRQRNRLEVLTDINESGNYTELSNPIVELEFAISVSLIDIDKLLVKIKSLENQLVPEPKLTNGKGRKLGI